MFYTTAGVKEETFNIPEFPAGRSLNFCVYGTPPRGQRNEKMVFDLPPTPPITLKPPPPARPPPTSSRTKKKKKKQEQQRKMGK